MEKVQKEIGHEKDWLLRLPQVLELVPVAKSTWWSWVAAGKAPAQIRLGRCSCWRYSDVIAFIEEGAAQ